MILVDANLLIYSKVTDFPQHKKARAWLEKKLSSPNLVGLPWPSLTNFLRSITNLRLFERPISSIGAWQQVEEWLALPNVWVPLPTDHHAEVFTGLIETAGVRGSLFADAHMASLAIEHGLTLCTTDSDYARFQDLRWKNPLG